MVHVIRFVSDFEREVKCLRKWLREMESRLQPLSFHINWTLPELEEKAIEHMVSTVLHCYCIYVVAKLLVFQSTFLIRRQISPCGIFYECYARCPFRSPFYFPLSHSTKGKKLIRL